MLLMFMNYYTFLRYLSNKYKRFQSAEELSHWISENPIDKYHFDYIIFWIGLCLRIILLKTVNV